MNKATLISKMIEKCDGELSKKQTEMALNAFMDSVQEALVDGDKISLVGFGSFETKQRAARQGRNPRDPQQIIERPASTAVTFKPSRTLKESVNK